MSDTVKPLAPGVMGSARVRADAVEKVRGTAPYAVEHTADRPLTLWLVTSQVARGRVRRVDASAALEHPGVVAVLDHTTTPRVADSEDRELSVLQEDTVHFRGQVVAMVAAETTEAAREGARLVRVDYDEQPHDAELRADSETYAPEEVNGGHQTDHADGDVAAAMAGATVRVDEEYRTPEEFNHPMEPHAVTAHWDGTTLTLHDSTQAVHSVVETLGKVLGLAKDQLRVSAPYVGGGFGSKGLPHAPEAATALAAMALPGRSLRLAVTRQQMFSLTGYRTRTVSRVRLGATDDGTLSAVEHHATSQTATFKEFAEQTATAARMMYAAPSRSTTHRVARLDVPVPSWMRAPGEMPGMYAHEVAMDELAVACGVDPIELRERNEPEIDPETGHPFNDRRLLDCLHRGAERFGWADRPAEAGARVDGEWRVGTGVAASTYPAFWSPGNGARIVALADGRYSVGIGAVDIGTGARTVLAQIAADALAVDYEDVDVQIADTELPFATVAGGSSGTASWGTAIALAAQRFRDEHGPSPAVGAETTATTEEYPDTEGHALHSFGAVFAEARVHLWTGEVRVPRLLGVYSVGRVINPVTARSQLIGGLVMGLSAALLEEGFRDPRFGHVVTQDLATYHVASHADVLDVDAEWLDEEDHLVTPMGSRGIGEIGIVGTAAAVANATYHATGTRVRSLPITADRFLEG